MGSHERGSAPRTLCENSVGFVNTTSPVWDLLMLICLWDLLMFPSVGFVMLCLLYWDLLSPSAILHLMLGRRTGQFKPSKKKIFFMGGGGHGRGLIGIIIGFVTPASTLIANIPWSRATVARLKYRIIQTEIDAGTMVFCLLQLMGLLYPLIKEDKIP